MENGTIAMLVFGAVMATGLPWHLQTLLARHRRRTARARGRVVDVAWRDTDRHEVGSWSPGTWHAVVEFEASGRPRRFESAYGVSWKKPRVGETSAVCFDPRDPANAEVDRGQGSVWLRAAQVLAVVAGVALVAAALTVGV